MPFYFPVLKKELAEDLAIHISKHKPTLKNKKSSLFNKPNELLLNAFRIPSFYFLLIMILSILILDRTNISDKSLLITLVLSLVISGIVTIILIVIKKYNTITVISSIFFLFFSISIFFLPHNYNSTLHIRNFLALSEQISSIEYKIISYPSYNYTYMPSYYYKAEVNKIYLINGREIQSYGKISLIYNTNSKTIFNIGDIISTNKLPLYTSKKFYNKGKLNILNITMPLYLYDDDITYVKAKKNNIYSIIYEIRKYINKLFYKYYTPYIKALAKSMVLGDKGELDENIEQLFNINNTSHLLAISGLHLGIIIAGLSLLIKLMKVSRKFGAFLLIPPIIIFALIIGSKPGIIRASLTIIIGIIAYTFLERKRDYFNILYLVMIIVLLFQPGALFNIGYQLSFISVFAILFFLIPIQTIIERKIRLYEKPKPLRFIIPFLLYPPVITFIIQIVSSPIIIINFGTVNIFGIIANALLIPIFILFIYSIIIFISLSFLPHMLLLYISAVPELFGRFFLYISALLSKIQWNITINENIKYISIGIWFVLIILLGMGFIFITGKNSYSNTNINKV
ncbi:MAG: ComEC/Rec2 family competence protein [Spirochaetota bacterium]